MARRKPIHNPTPARSLRERAEELLRAQPAEMPTLRTEDVQALVHELNVHQMELEIQNEELRQAQVELSHARDRYADLYEFAPVGYVMLDRDGRILQANLTAAKMLGVDRQALLRANISNFVTRESQDESYLHRQAVFSSDVTQTCEIDMHTAAGTPLVARLESIAFGPQDDLRCRTALIDVTAARSAEQQLQQSEQRYRRLTEAVTDYIYRVRVEQGRAVATIHGVNCEAATGYTPEEFAADPLQWIAMVPPEDRAVVEQQATRLLTGDNVLPIEHRLCRKDGEIRWVLNTTSIQRDNQGRVIAYDGLLRDITERKAAEAALQQLNVELELRVAERTHEIRLLAEAVSHLGEGVVITDDELEWPGPRILFVNDAMCRITGYTADELIGKTPRALQGKDTDRETLDHLKAELSVGRFCLVELVNYRKDRTPYDAELFITPLYDSEGRRTNFVSIHRDITKRKQSEQELRDREARLQAIWNTAADAIITIDHTGIIDGFNPTAERMFGYSREEMIGQNVKILMPSPYRDEHDGYIARYLETGEARIIGIGREVVGQHKDGYLFPIDLAVSEIDHQQRFTGIIRDISERKALQGHLLTIAAEEQRRIGQDLHDSVGQQVLALAMTARTLSQMLKEQSSPEKLQGLAMKLVDGLKDTLAQVRALSKGLVPVEVEAEGLMSALKELAAEISRVHGVSCMFDCDQPVRVTDSEKATHLYRIAQEAVTNAVKHARTHDIRIGLKATDDAITLTVRDYGIGMPLADRSHDGIGLRIMQYRANLVGGWLAIEPLNEGGTLVTCTVPGGRFQ